MFYVMCSTFCVCMFLCLLYAPIHQNKFQVGVNLLGNKYYSDSDSDSDSDSTSTMGSTGRMESGTAPGISKALNNVFKYIK